MKNEYCMIALDLDGTLTNSDKIITRETYDALMQAQRQGVQLVLASGRPTYGILPLAKQLHMDEYGGYILSFNGGKIIECRSREILFQQTLPASRLHEVFELADRYHLAALTYENDAILTEHPDDPYVQEEAWINKLSVRHVVHLNEAIYFPVVKCLLVGEASYLASVEPKIGEELGEEFEVYRSAPYFLEVVSRGIDKGASLDRLLRKVKVEPSRLIAFGDGYNDGSMIRYAGLGVVMANGVDALKADADFVTKSNDEDGVAYALKKFLL